MFSVLDSALLLYKTRFVFIICSPFLTPSYSYTSPAGLFIIMNSLSLTPSYSFLYQTRVIYSHFTIILLCPTLISDQVQIFSILDSVLLLYQTRLIYSHFTIILLCPTLKSDRVKIFSILNSVLLLYQTRLIYSHFTIILLCPTLISDRVHIFSILDSVLLLYETGFIYSLSLTPSYYYTRPGSYVVYPFLFLLVVICKTIQEKES